MLGDLLGNQKWVGILLELQQKLDRDLVLNCKILSSNIIAILFALLHTDYRKSIWGHLALGYWVGRSVLDLGSDSAILFVFLVFISWKTVLQYGSNTHG